MLEVHLLQSGDYITEAYDETDEVSVTVLPGCVIPLREVFFETAAGAETPRIGD
jgi:hypothetical protein